MRLLPAQYHGNIGQIGTGGFLNLRHTVEHLEEGDAMTAAAAPAKRLLIAASTAAWLITVAVDFLLHAVLLAPWWRATEAYWLPPMQLFARIPFAYAAFAIYCALLSWLLIRLYGPGLSLRRGVVAGAAAGLIYGTAGILANYSVFPLPLSALLVWPLAAMLESAAAGGVCAWVLHTAHPWRRVGMVAGITAALLILSIILQNVLFPAASIL
jgi:hypothetical protein